MRHVFAPMEGLTDSIFRRLHHRYFPGVDGYYMPFISPTIHRTLTAKEQRDLPPAESLAVPAVPQVLTKNAQDFLWAAKVCQDLGYTEINLNAGCPSGTVVAKGKGSGLLRDLDALAAFLDEVCAASPLPVSVKTRLGLEDAQEFPRLVALYNQYPLREVIVHPRVRTQFYAGSVDMDAFSYAAAHCIHPLCYNGDIRTPAQLHQLEQTFPQLSGVMIGRGLLENPALFTPNPAPQALQALMDGLLEEYTQVFGSSRNAMFRLKEHWSYLHRSFSGSEKLFKSLRKTTDVAQFRAITQEIFQSCPFAPAQ